MNRIDELTGKVPVDLLVAHIGPTTSASLRRMIRLAICSAYNAGLERAAESVRDFRTGGPASDTWTAWGEGLAKNILALKEE